MRNRRALTAALIASMMMQSISIPTTVNASEKVPAASDDQKVQAKQAVGQVEITLDLLLPVNYGGSIGLVGTLTNEKKETKQIAFQYDADNQKIQGMAKDCEAGSYTLTIQGKGYQRYEQTIEVHAQSITKLQLKNSHEMDGLFTETSRPGVIGYGDVTQDGIVDDKDMELLLDAIEQGVEDSKYDLNRDGTVDLVDASYIAYNSNETNTQGTLNIVLSPDAIEAVEVTGTMEGETKDLFSPEKTVSLKPEKEEAISESNPIQLEIGVNSNGSTTGAITIAPPSGGENAITEGTIKVEDEDGVSYEAVIVREGEKSQKRTRSKQATATIAADGSIVVDLKGQVAIKKVTITVTGTSSRKLAEIAQVEFLNDMESKIPAPTIAYPTAVTAQPGNKEFTVTWNKMSNVTGYEVEVSNGSEKEVLSTETNSITVKAFQREEIKNGMKFNVRVQSVNGDWRSGYSNAIEVIPKASSVPPAPENIKIEGGYGLLNVSWKAMEDTDSYRLYYREQGTTDEYKLIENITKTTAQITGLKNNTKYEIYLEGVNELGVGKKSVVCIGTTTELEHAKTSNYKLINVPTEDGKTAHIASVSYPTADPKNEFAVVDNNYATDWILNSWTSGGYAGGINGPIVTFDNFYKMDRMIVVESTKQTYDYFYSKVKYWDKDGKAHEISGRHTVKTDAAGKRYYEINLQEPIVTNKVQIGFSNYLAYDDGMISIAEMKFYHYDSLEEEISDLFEDETRLTLKPGVTKETIDTLEQRLEVKDPVSGEYHFKKGILEVELKNARAILDQEQLREAMKIDTAVTKANDGHLGFQNGLNAWQPLGITAHEGEQLVIYVGKEGAKVGDPTDLRVIASQVHGEHSAWHKVVTTLKVGRNEITVPRVHSIDVEHGGSLYVEYTGRNSNVNMSVRVSGGTTIPVLNVANMTSEAEKKAAIRAYLQELHPYVASLERMHKEGHEGHPETNCNYGYDAKNCIYNVTEVVMDQMYYSVAAEQVANGIKERAGSDSLEAQVEAMYDTLCAMEQEVALFYQHKGLVAYPEDKEEYQAFVKKYGEKNKLPQSRLNIRYQRMFTGAFMYAGGGHIGIEWGSIPGLMSGQVVKHNDGAYVSGQLFGWGIAHEIGHIINQSDYTVAEVTNNYYAQLVSAKETNDSVRFDYKDVYEKVTSGTLGPSDNKAVGIAMYWQLHLAYDEGYNYKTYATYDEQFDNLIFARMDAYARNNEIAPKFKDGKAFTLKDAKDTDNNIMRLACAATKKDLLDYFRSWGMVPDQTTILYASQFEKETRDIQYITDEARVYRVENRANAERIEQETKAAKPEVRVENKKNSKQVTLELGATGIPAERLLGYEIKRNGVTVAFVSGEETSYVDTVTMNNRVVEYSVIAHDKFLNKTEEVYATPIKVTHDGRISKDRWNVTTNMSSVLDRPTEDDVCGTNPTKAITTVIDDDYTTVYTGSVEKGNPEIVLDLGEVAQIAGVRYTKADEHAIREYEVYISKNGADWTLVKEGVFDAAQNEETIFFTKEDDKKGTRMDLQQASKVKLVVKGQQTVGIKELDIVGEPDDNVELVENGIGILQKDLVVDETNGEAIPAGSIVVTGEYTGHPAYNVVLLIDADTDKVIGGSQYIFAADPKDESLGAVSNGTWLYVVEPYADGKLPKNIKAELYRVDDAITLEGQRLVSDTLTVQMPTELKEITIQK